MKRQDLPRHAPTANGLSFLIDSQAALAAAERLEQDATSGVRFCCEHREMLTLAEARRRDALEMARRTRMGEGADDGEQEPGLEQATMAITGQRSGSADRLHANASDDDELDADDDFDDRPVEFLLDNDLDCDLEPDYA